MNKLLKTLTLSLSLVLPLNLTLAASYEGLSAEDKGLAIAQESDRRDQGWTDSQNSMTMVLRNKSGEVSERKIRSQNFEMQGDGDKGLTIFDKPTDVKGTAFLSFTHINEADDQWLYLPALKRVKRISSSNKSGPFMGSEFSYEDLSSFEVDKYKYKFLRDDQHNGEDVFVVELYPQYEHSGYTKIISWVDKSEYRIRKMEFFDRKDSPLKTLVYGDYKQYLGQYWRAHTMQMVNHQTGKSTDLFFEDYQFKTGLEEKDFSKNSLKRLR